MREGCGGESESENEFYKTSEDESDILDEKSAPFSQQAQSSFPPQERKIHPPPSALPITSSIPLLLFKGEDVKRDSKEAKAITKEEADQKKEMKNLHIHTGSASAAARLGLLKISPMGQSLPVAIKTDSSLVKSPTLSRSD